MASRQRIKADTSVRVCVTLSLSHTSAQTQERKWRTDPAWHEQGHAGGLAGMAILGILGAPVPNCQLHLVLPRHTPTSRPQGQPGPLECRPGHARRPPPTPYRGPPPAGQEPQPQRPEEPLTTLSSGTDRLNVHSWLFTKASVKQDVKQSQTPQLTSVQSECPRVPLSRPGKHQGWWRPPPSSCSSYPIPIPSLGLSPKPGRTLHPATPRGLGNSMSLPQTSPPEPHQPALSRG